jgi:hypothetical protein
VTSTQRIILRFVAATALAAGLFPAAAATQVPEPAAKPAATVLPSVTLPPALDRVLRDYERAWQGKDPAGLANLFTEDGMTLSNGRAWQRGRAVIEKGYTGAGAP